MNTEEYHDGIGVTAGASTPDWIIREVIEIMEQNENNQEQLELMAEFDKRFKIGDEVEGEVISKNNEGIFAKYLEFSK